MRTLTRKEELILLSIVALKENAYLIAIQEHLSEVTGRSVSLTSVHLPLSRLEKAGLLDAHYGEASAKRGGRRKKIYRLTRAGYHALEEHKKVSDALWAHYSKLATG